MNRYENELESLARDNALRTLRDIRHSGTNIVVDGREMLNLSSNDYLGIGSDTSLWKEFSEKYASCDEFGGGACSSRLLTGNHAGYRSLEDKLAKLYGKEASLVCVSGYHANIGILPAVTTSRDLILADKLVHASIIDGIRLSRARSVRFEHNNMERLESILKKERTAYENVFIVTESVFSMDGDLADLKKLTELKKKYDAFLYVDEAHAIGVRSEKGLGLCEETGTAKDIDFLVGTFGKAAASQGAFVATSRIFRDYLVNTMRPLIFSTALPPVSVRWTEFVMDRMDSFGNARRHLSAISDKLRDRLSAAGFETRGNSNIIPVILGSNERAVGFSQYLCDNGFFVLPIRTPTVPAGSERVRISLTAAITNEQIEKLIDICRRFGT